VKRAAQRHPHKRVRVIFEDEARFGQQGTLSRVWAERGTRPSVVRQNGRRSIWVFGAVEPLTGRSTAMMTPKANTDEMQSFVTQVARQLVGRRAHGIMVLDGAGFHIAKKLRWPRNLEPLFLPPYSPELNPMELVWRYARQRHWSNREHAGTGELITAALHALDALGRSKLRSICHTKWLTRALQL